MRPTARTAPVPGADRQRSPVTALMAAVVVAVLAGLGFVAPPPGPSGAGGFGPPVAAERLHHDGTRADDGCDAVRAVRAAARPEQPHGEHPAPCGHSGTRGRTTDTAPHRPTGPYAPAAGPGPAAQPPVGQDRGRAPPVSPGT
ncbi:hypothetical protein ACFV20_35805 [Streptomyces sp. NPDC059696]|uniref:hypothetical protein n=1 Tax=Streptomyces sp. NPDC059696 TaxID=3346911 RepID=UPI0036CB3083